MKLGRTLAQYGECGDNSTSPNWSSTFLRERCYGPMPKDTYVFFALIAAMIILRLTDLPRGVHFFLFSALVVGQVALLLHGFASKRRSGR